MNSISKPERVTQNRVVKLFQERLQYRYLGHWQDRVGNSNIEENILTNWLTQRGYSASAISAALFRLRTEANNGSRGLYENNRKVYSLLRYGVPVKVVAGKVTEDVWLIDWENPEENDFAIAEEVTLKGNLERRPDVVLYVNGIAIAILELKNSRTSLAAGIRQSLSNQRPEFNAWFFATNQLVFAGNDSEGLRYGTTLTEEKFFLTWKEDPHLDEGYTLDKYLVRMCEKSRLLDLLKHFVLFDGGIKKVPRVHQYFGIKEAQKAALRREGGIIWHTQGSGKSIVMVLLARWILENLPNARVAIVTDRDALDKQILRVFQGTGETIYRAKSGADLIRRLGEPKERLLCSLVHKFGRQETGDFERFIEELKAAPSPAVGEIFVFVDECHRTQSGKLNKTMMALLPDAVFMGFTGTPLLKQDKQTSLELFGRYIHTYKFGEAVKDKVILDLMYEARDVNQRLTSQDAVDEWFELVSEGLNDWQKSELRAKWGTKQSVLSSESRMKQIVQDILKDFKRFPRLKSGYGNALLVASSIYEACKYYELFESTPFKGRTALVTSYNPQAKALTLEETGANSDTDRQSVFNTYTKLLKDITPSPKMSKAETYEEQAKDRFIKTPGQMRVLIVVDKLLTGFDAPSCTFLYIDKSMQDHGLFQAICRTNRLDGVTKDFGYVVDYKDLFKKVEKAIEVYTSELDHSSGDDTSKVLMQDRLTRGKERIADTLEALTLLCEPVLPPKDDLAYRRYFCGNPEIPTDLEERATLRGQLYKATAAFLRAFANMADELASAGFTPGEIAHLKERVTFYTNLREIIRITSAETLDLKQFEADMRNLIDSYIQADTPRKISPFDDLPLLTIIQQLGIERAIESLPPALRENEEAIAEAIANNVRSTIIQEQMTNPAFYNSMSQLLNEVLADLRAKRIEYADYLEKVAEIARRLGTGGGEDFPPAISTGGLRTLYQNLGEDEAKALQVDAVVHANAFDDWRGSQTKERALKQALYEVLEDVDEVVRVFNIIYQQKDY